MRLRGGLWMGLEISMASALQLGVGVPSLQRNCADLAGFETSTAQSVLQEKGCTRQSIEKEGFIMGWGGYLTLLNGSPSNWVVTGTSSYQMPAWSWPTVQAGTQAVYR
jgi:hypothetical protein